jgi:hypothetical protein
MIYIDAALQVVLGGGVRYSGEVVLGGRTHYMGDLPYREGDVIEVALPRIPSLSYMPNKPQHPYGPMNIVTSA